MSAPVCPACGARLAPGATQCDLCGHVLDDAAPLSEEEAVVASDPAPSPIEDEASEVSASGADEAIPPSASAPVAAGETEGPFCVHCGTKNPAYARFCYQCGQALHSAAEAPVLPEGAVPVVQAAPVVPVSPPTVADTPGVRPDSDPGKRALMLLGAGVLAVLVLFFLTRASQDEAPPPPRPTPTATPAPTGPTQLSGEAAAEVARLEGEIEAATNEEERLTRQEQLAGFFAQNGAFDRAAAVQAEVAEARGTALAWADAGSLFLAHMLRTQGPERADYARRAAEHYERSLALDANDLDVKTDLATAYLNDETNPMRAVQTVKEVLETDPEHVRANFNYGLMLAQINRVDQAEAQFQKVVDLTEPEDPVHQRAEQELARMQAAQRGTANG